jgi:hypothetical protein
LDNACIPIEGKCNGVNNCADGSDESGCVAGIGGVTVEPATGLTANIEIPVLQSLVFTDREYTFDSLGSFEGYNYIKMSNDDKHIRHSHVQMKLRLTQPTMLYVVKLDDYTLPWLEQEGWTIISTLEGVQYHGVRQTRHTDWSGVLTEDHYGPGEVYAKTFTAGTVEMRGNNGGDGSYLIFLANPAHAPHAPTSTPVHLDWEWASPTDWNIQASSSWNGHYLPDNVKVASGRPWHTGTSNRLPQTMTFDAQQPVTINAFATVHPTGWGGSAMQHYVFSRSDDGATWTEVISGVGNNLQNVERQEIEFPTVTSRHFKLHMTSNYGYGNYITIQHFEVHNAS